MILSDGFDFDFDLTITINITVRPTSTARHGKRRTILAWYLGLDLDLYLDDTDGSMPPRNRNDPADGPKTEQETKERHGGTMMSPPGKK
jgi:hypothetical protein